MTNVSSSAPACMSRSAYANPDPITHSSDNVHTVQKGDTMTAIARRNNMSLNELKKANPQIGDPNRIEVGDRVRIPTMSIDPAQATGVSRVRDAYEGTSSQNNRSTNTATGNLSGSSSNATPRPSAARDVTGSLDNNIATGAQLTGAAADIAETVAPYAATTARGSRAVSKVASRMSTGANIVGGVATFVDQAANGTQTTTAGRVVNGGTAAATNTAFGIANPVAATADAISGALGGPSLSEHTNRGIDALTTVGEGLITGDTRGMEDLNQRNLNGENGTPMQVAASYGEALANGDTRHLENYQEQALRGDHGSVPKVLAESGDFWAEKGVVGGLQEFGSELLDFLW